MAELRGVPKQREPGPDLHATALLKTVRAAVVNTAAAIAAAAAVRDDGTAVVPLW